MCWRSGRASALGQHRAQGGVRHPRVFPPPPPRACRRVRPLKPRVARPGLRARREAAAPHFPGSFVGGAGGLGQRTDRPVVGPWHGGGLPGNSLSRAPLPARFPGPRKGAVPPRPRGPRLPGGRLLPEPAPPSAPPNPGEWRAGWVRPRPGDPVSRPRVPAGRRAWLREPGDPAWAARAAAPTLPVQDSPDAPRSSREGH